MQDRAAFLCRLIRAHFRRGVGLALCVFFLFFFSSSSWKSLQEIGPKSSNQCSTLHALTFPQQG